jgi:pSer/pThr/pTyr-binding forkhead associated (FHA) protein
MTGDIININTTPQQGSDNWHEVRVRLQGPKSLASPTDVRRPVFQGHLRPVLKREGFHATPTVRTSRLTLSSTRPCGHEAYVQLLAGDSLHLGRARTWDPRASQNQIPNDIVLRTRATEEYDDYISRYHGVIRLSNGDYVYENLSQNGSEVTGRSLDREGETIGLRDNVTIWPGRRALTNSPKRDQMLGLRVQRTKCAVRTEVYNLLVRDSHLASGFDVDQSHDAITLFRTDKVGELEHYVFFPHATYVGSNDSTCGWRINDPSVQSVHAILLWFDQSFWIEPFEDSCKVLVQGKTIVHHKPRRLTPGSTLQIGDKSFLVLPEWKQHILDCRCCQGHG